jgi:hypothetical protein
MSGDDWAALGLSAVKVVTAMVFVATGSGSNDRPRTG